MVSLPKLPSCCGCCSLKTGTIIVGCINLFFSIIGIILCFVVLLSTDSMISYFEKMMDEGAPDWRQSMDTSLLRTVLIGVMVFLLILAVFSVALASLLIHGARMGKPGLLKPWIILSGIGLILDIFNIIKALIALQFLDAFSSIIAWVFGAYIFLVVYSFKCELEDAELPDYSAGGYKREEQEMMNA